MKLMTLLLLCLPLFVSAADHGGAAAESKENTSAPVDAEEHAGAAAESKEEAGGPATADEHAGASSEHGGEPADAKE